MFLPFGSGSQKVLDEVFDDDKGLQICLDRLGDDAVPREALCNTASRYTIAWDEITRIGL